MAFTVAALRLFTVVLWVGGLCFFVFVVAPVAFGELADKHAAGLVVGHSLRMLHRLGLVSAILFAGATLTQIAIRRRSKRFAAGEITLCAVMFVLTAYSEFDIIPRMERARVDAGGEIADAAPGTSAADRFRALHARSEYVEGMVLLLGLGLIALLSWQHASTEPRL